MDLESLFAQNVQSLLAAHPGPALWVFRGFGAGQAAWLAARPDALLPETPIKDGLFHLSLVENHKKQMLAALLTADKPVVALYEELLVLHSAVNDLAGTLGMPVYIVENNLLCPWQPCLLPEEQWRALDRYFQSDRDCQDETTRHLSHIYCDLKTLGDRVLLMPRNIAYEKGIRVLPFWTEADTGAGLPDEDADRITLGTVEDRICRLDLLEGKAQPALFLHRQDSPVPEGARALMGALNALGVPAGLDTIENQEDSFVYSDRQFLPLLRQYWGQNASFRPLLFYRDPARSKETVEISQGSLIAEIVDQCEQADDDMPSHDIFITAPTGAGKSILFQLPALYLAQRYQMVTVVISPLIALMNDQVEQLTHQRGIDCAACLNSSLSMDERLAILEEIRQGKKSLIYLAPELLLTTNLDSLLGGRKIGLLVIDEAHTVTSWGRDFRSDYWFLGDFLAKCRQAGKRFPVLCLTATAVYSGGDDVVLDTIQELGLNTPILHLGNVRRDNIRFDIQVHTEALTDKVDNVKMNLTLARMRDLVGKGEKALAYFPFRSQVDEIYRKLRPEEHIRLRRYHGQLNTAERSRAEQDYRSGQALGLFCTKAFGMGVDVSDIRHVIHYAPTGTLADYVQEIGRAARDPQVQGEAHIDFFGNDMRYVRALNGISEMKQYQLKEMLKKLWSIYSKKQRRNLLISAETFEYLFPAKEVDNRTKSGLLLLARDLRYKYAFPVLVVRPRAMLSKNYVNIPDEIRDKVLKKLGPYATEVAGHTTRIIDSNSVRNAATLVRSTGSTYLLDMEGIWENLYSDMPFGVFKKQFFENAPDPILHPDLRLSPRVRVEVKFNQSFDEASEKLDQVLSAIVGIFDRHKRSEVKQFTLKDFEEELTEALGERPVSHDKFPLLIDIFTASVEVSNNYNAARSQICVLQRRRRPGYDEPVYMVMGSSYNFTQNALDRMMSRCKPQNGDLYESYRPILKDRPIEGMPLFKLLELLGLASYEIRGGEKAEVFLRINDPQKIHDIAYGPYRNVILQEIHRRHQASAELLKAFFTAELDNDDRWSVIEEYFLGHEQEIRARLGMADTAGAPDAEGEADPEANPAG